MRMFLTSYQKSGTYQAYPMFVPHCPHIKDWGHVSNIGLDEFIRRQVPGPLPAFVKAVEGLINIKERAFGHIPYLAEYAQAVQAQPTKVVFNYRDPRDIIVAELEMIKKHQRAGTIQHAWHNYRRLKDNIRVIDREHPIAELIYIASIKWKNWIGWLDHDFVIPLKYEDLRLRPKETVAKLVADLKGCHLPQSPSAMIKSMKKGRTPGMATPTFRKGLVGEWKNYFSDDEIVLAQNLLGPILKRLDYE